MQRYSITRGSRFSAKSVPERAFQSWNRSPSNLNANLHHGLLGPMAKGGSHQPRISAPVKNRDDPERLLVWCIGDEVLIARDMESQRPSGQVRTSVSDVW